MLFLHLFNRTESSAKTSDLGEFLLDFLQPILSLASEQSGLARRVGVDGDIAGSSLCMAEQDWNVSPFQNLS